MKSTAKEKIRILFITQWFQPEPFYKGIPFAKALQERGYEVQVLTGFPNYPTGKVYPGYKIRFFQKESMEGISVIRIPLYPSHDSSAVGRIANYLSFALSAAMLGPWLIRRPDVIYVYHPPPTTYLPAFVLKLLYRVPVIYDIQDFWPDTLAATGMFNNHFGLKLVAVYCKLFYKIAAKLVVLSPGFKEKLIQNGVPENKIEIIYNWFDEKNLNPGRSSKEVSEVLKHKDSFKVLFAGNMGKVQALETVLEAANLLKDSNPQIQFVFMGAGVEVEHLQAESVRMNLFNVHFLSPVPPEQMGEFLDAADVLLVHLKRDPLFEITIPSKIQAYLAAGKPILVAVPGDASELVMRAQAGFPCESENPDALAQKVVEFSRMSNGQLLQLGENGKRFYKKYMSMQVGADHFDRLFRGLISEC